MTNTGTSNITSAILKVMSGVSFVQKAGKNEFHGYKYATEGDALAALRPHLIANELVILSDVIEHTSPDEFGNTTVKVQYRIIHSSGEELVCHFVGCGNDRSSKGAIGDKGIYKALTGANKYFLLKTFQLETGDDPERDDTSGDKGADYLPPQRQKKTSEPKPQAQEQDAPGIDVDVFISQVKDELEHCGTKDEVKQVWRRYQKEIGVIKVSFADREQEIVSVFASANKQAK
jgi:hypothetical protein